MGRGWQTRGGKDASETKQRAQAQCPLTYQAVEGELCRRLAKVESMA